MGAPNPIFVEPLCDPPKMIRMHSASPLRHLPIEAEVGAGDADTGGAGGVGHIVNLNSGLIEDRKVEAKRSLKAAIPPLRVAEEDGLRMRLSGGGSAIVTGSRPAVHQSARQQRPLLPSVEDSPLPSAEVLRSAAGSLKLGPQIAVEEGGVDPPQPGETVFFPSRLQIRLLDRPSVSISEVTGGGKGVSVKAEEAIDIPHSVKSDSMLLHSAGC